MDTELVSGLILTKETYWSKAFTTCIFLESLFKCSLKPKDVIRLFVALNT